MTDNQTTGLQCKTGLYSDEELAALVDEHFNVKPYSLVLQSKKYRSHTVTSKVKRASDLPILSVLCAKLGVSTGKLTKTSKEDNYPLLKDSIERARDVQRNMLILNGLEGLYDTKYAEFVAINLVGMRKTQHLESNIKTDTGVHLYLPEVLDTVKTPLINVTPDGTGKAESIAVPSDDIKSIDFKDVNVGEGGGVSAGCVSPLITSPVAENTL